MNAPHTSVLLREVVQAFEGVELQRFFDGTLGAGGHAAAILSTHPEMERYIGCDRDPRAHEIARGALTPWREKVEFVHASYSDLARILEEWKIGCVQGVLIDAGVSSMQLNERERGFSFRGDGPLDMRMDPTASLTAERIVNHYPEAEIARILHEYGEERRSRPLARAIVAARKKRPLKTAADLVKIVEPIVGQGSIHPATRTFQALRIAVNDELGELERGIREAIGHLCVGGRIAVISFHSLEDRIAKTLFRELEWKEAKRGREEAGCLKILTKKPAVPTEEEIRVNPRSRSAKMRIAEKIRI